MNDVRAHIFYDQGNTGYYADLAGITNVNRITAISMAINTADAGGAAVQGVNSGGGSQGLLGYAGWGVYCQSGGCGGWDNWFNNSDRRLKENIEPVKNSLEKVLKLQGVTYDWKDPVKHKLKGNQLGLIAQDVEKIFPEVVEIDRSPTSTFKDGTRTMQYSSLISPIIEAIKEFYAKFTAYINQNDARVEALEKENAKLKARLDKIESQMRTPASK